VIRPFSRRAHFQDRGDRGSARWAAKACQAANIRAACDGDSLQVTPNTKAVCSGKGADDKLRGNAKAGRRHQPQRQAQYRSGSEEAFACSTLAGYRRQ